MLVRTHMQRGYFATRVQGEGPSGRGNRGKGEGRGVGGQASKQAELHPSHDGEGGRVLSWHIVRCRASDGYIGRRQLIPRTDA